MEPPAGCNGVWTGNNHILFQIAHALILLGFLAPNVARGSLLLHGLMCGGE